MELKYLPKNIVQSKQNKSAVRVDLKKGISTTFFATCYTVSIEVKKIMKIKKQNDIIQSCYFLFMFFCLVLR